MKRLSLIVAAMLAISVCAVSAQSADEAVAKFKEGTEKAQAKQFAEAAADYEAALAIAKQVEGQEELIAAINQQLPTLYLYHGVTAIKAKDYTTCFAALKKAKEVAQANGVTNVLKQASRYLSMAYQTQGADAFNAKDYKTALEAFKQGYAEDPTNVKLANLTAKSYAELGMINEAAEIWNKTIEKNGDNEKYAAEVASAKADLNQYLLIEGSKLAEAKDFDGISALADGTGVNCPGVQFLAVQVANTLKKYDAVIARADKAASLQTEADDKSAIYLMLGVAYQNKGNNAKAIEALKKVTAGATVSQAKAIIAELSK